MECGIMGSKSISEAMGYLQTRRRYVSCKPGRRVQLSCKKHAAVSHFKTEWSQMDSARLDDRRQY